MGQTSEERAGAGAEVAGRLAAAEGGSNVEVGDRPGADRSTVRK